MGLSHIVPSGRMLDLTRTRYSAAAIRYIIGRPGMVRRILGREEALGIEGIEVVRIDAREGQVLGPVRSSLDRHGHVIAAA